MMRRALVAALAAAVAEQGAADWQWQARTQAEQRAAGECPSDTAAPNWILDTGITQFPSTSVSQAESYITASALMNIDYHQNFKVITSSHSKEQFVLTQCGTAAPNDAAVDAVRALETGYTRKFFTIPLQRVIMESTTMLGFAKALGLEDRMVGVSPYSVAPCYMKARTECGAALEAGGQWGNDTLKNLQRASADGVFMDCQPFGDPAVCSSVTELANGIGFNPTVDPGNLHQAEYIKIMAAFFNKEAEANQLFQTIVSTYQQFTPLSPRPVVAWISFSDAYSWGGVDYPDQFEISWADYKRQYVTDAGYANVDITAVRNELPLMTESGVAPGLKYVLKVSDYPDLATAGRALIAALTNANVYAVIDEKYAGWGVDPATYTMDTFHTNYGSDASSNALFISGQKVIRIDGVMSSDFNYDWLESRIARPDWAVEGLRRALSGDASLRRKYFRNIATEAPEVLTTAMCQEEMPFCDSALPDAIPASGGVPTTTVTTTTVTTTTVTTTEENIEAGGARAVSCVAALLLPVAALVLGF